jgi:hypothetical protein
MNWQSPSVQQPPQGVKILWFKNGDLFVAQRVGKRYLSLQPGEAVLLDEPKLWMKAPVPPPYEGIMMVSVENGDKLMVDEFEEKHPEDYKEFVKSFENMKWKE